MNKVIIVSGPTATGKTNLAITIAEKFPGCEIVNFDSLCFYREMNIGTAKPDQGELSRAPHHLINTNSINEKLNAADFCDMANEKINQLHQAGKIPILTGGSAFYLRALIKGMYQDLSESDSGNKAQDLYNSEGIGPILDYLKINDPESFDRLHENDHYRLTRAMEYHLNTGEKISDQKKEFDLSDPYDFSQNEKNWQIHHIYLDMEKSEHWEIIKNRTSMMIKNGLIEEVRDLIARGYSSGLKPLQCIGYKQVMAFLEQQKSDTKALEEEVFIATRRLAKSQRTFFKKITPKLSYHPLNDGEKILKDLHQFFS